MNTQQLINIYEAGKIALELEKLETEINKYIVYNDFQAFYEIYKEGIELSEKHDSFIRGLNVEEEKSKLWNKEFFINFVEPFYKEHFDNQTNFESEFDDDLFDNIMYIENKEFFNKHFPTNSFHI